MQRVENPTASPSIPSSIQGGGVWRWPSCDSIRLIDSISIQLIDAIQLDHSNSISIREKMALDLLSMLRQIVEFGFRAGGDRRRGLPQDRQPPAQAARHRRAPAGGGYGVRGRRQDGRVEVRRGGRMARQRCVACATAGRLAVGPRES